MRLCRSKAAQRRQHTMHFLLELLGHSRVVNLKKSQRIPEIRWILARRVKLQYRHCARKEALKKQLETKRCVLHVVMATAFLSTPFLSSTFFLLLSMSSISHHRIPLITLSKSRAPFQNCIGVQRRGKGEPKNEVMSSLHDCNVCILV